MIRPRGTPVAGQRALVTWRWAVLLSLAVWVLPVQAETAPDWQLPGLDGGSLGLGELRGQIVLLDFWASWCVPCRLSLPALRQLQKDYAQQPVRIVTISVDEDRTAARDFLQRYGQGLTALHDPDGQVAEAYDLLGMPSSFIIGPQGQIQWQHAGYRKGDEDAWRDQIEHLLAADP